MVCHMSSRRTVFSYALLAAGALLTVPSENQILSCQHPVVDSRHS